MTRKALSYRDLGIFDKALWWIVLQLLWPAQLESRLLDHGTTRSFLVVLTYLLNSAEVHVSKDSTSEPRHIFILN